MKNYSIILASSSPRRIEILKSNNQDPFIMPPDVEESLPEHFNMEQAVMYLALKKALYVEKEWLNSTQQTKDASIPVIIGADTMVYKNSIIGKPIDFDDAVNILKNLRNSSHLVATGVALIVPGANRRQVFCEITEVFFEDYSDAEIIQYVNTGEAYDKAGAYAIQGGFGKYVSHIKGDYENVIGLPWNRIAKELNKD